MPRDRFAIFTPAGPNDVLFETRPRPDHEPVIGYQLRQRAMWASHVHHSSNKVASHVNGMATFWLLWLIEEN
ncbi:MAG: hypothetical protein Q9212_003276 [Teloschistes hypoglaucus]